ncbi:MAG: HdeD family acid-resistance protein [Planctomycetota bacterium]|nr:MAG: HdeD family acid-resistance protein [Planctomycetota bacterium]REK43585.1 MAG: HdeD family acid-resistance protein [Planctomycetota bacterium]
MHELRSQWWCFLLLGIAQVVLGTFALGSSFYIGVFGVLTIGALLLISGVIQLVSSFWAGKWSGMLLNLMISIFYIVVGYFILENPGKAAAVLMVLTSAMLLVSGIFRCVVAMTSRYQDWGWVLLNGIISIALGVLIYRFVEDRSVEAITKSLWLIGLFIGIELLFNGWTWIMLSLGLRAAGDEDASE